jgi:hypothetical protein
MDYSPVKVGRQDFNGFRYREYGKGKREIRSRVNKWIGQ